MFKLYSVFFKQFSINYVEALLKKKFLIFFYHIFVSMDFKFIILQNFHKPDNAKKIKALMYIIFVKYFAFFFLKVFTSFKNFMIRIF